MANITISDIHSSEIKENYLLARACHQLRKAIAKPEN